MKKGTFCKLKTSLGRNFVYNLQTFRILSSAFLRFCRKFSMKIIFYLTVNNAKPKVFQVLVFVCTTASISSIENISKRDAHLGSGFKSENSQGYSELQEPIKTREIGITDLVNTNYYCYYIQIACPCGLR